MLYSTPQPATRAPGPDGRPPLWAEGLLLDARAVGGALPERHTRSGVFLNACTPWLPSCRILSPSGLARYNRYEQIRELDGDCLTDAFVADLTQNPDCRPTCGPIFKTSRRSSIWFSLSKQHLFTPAEMQLLHGWPSIPSLVQGSSASDFRSPDLSWSKLRSMQGNGMHLPCMSAFFSFCLSNVVRRRTLQGDPSAGLVAASGLGDDEQDEA